MSISRGFRIAFFMALSVISLKTMRLVVFFKPNASFKCQEIDSPSRSSSVANQTSSEDLAKLFSSDITLVLSGEIT